MPFANKSLATTGTAHQMAQTPWVWILKYLNKIIIVYKNIVIRIEIFSYPIYEIFLEICMSHI